MRNRLALLLPLLAFACAQLPDYALPTAKLVDPKQLANADAISYRKLTRADFRGAKSPLSDARQESHMSAFTCVNLVPQGNTNVEVRQERPGAPFVARTGKLSFVAKMDRGCSWWSPDLRGESPEYVLQHEQIHFAIFELAARDVTRRTRQLSGTGDSPEAAAAALQRNSDALFRAAIEAMTERNTRFDLDTSGRHVPEVQQRWLDEVSAELAR